MTMCYGEAEDVDEGMEYDRWRDLEDADKEATLERLHLSHLEEIAERSGHENS